MRRREFFSLLGNAAIWPIAASAQQPPMLVIGFLRSTSVAASVPMIEGFRQGLTEGGFNEGLAQTSQAQRGHGLPALKRWRDVSASPLVESDSNNTTLRYLHAE